MNWRKEWVRECIWAFIWALVFFVLGLYVPILLGYLISAPFLASARFLRIENRFILVLAAIEAGMCVALVREIKKLQRAKPIAVAKSVEIATSLVDWITHLASDRRGLPYPYEYAAVLHEVNIDADGNYIAKYTHVAKNISGQPVVSYYFDISTTERANLEALNAKAWLTIGTGLRQIAQLERDHPGAADTHLRIRVRLPEAVNTNDQFTVELYFEWPNVLKPEQDGDAIDLVRFKTFSPGAKIKITLNFDKPVSQGSWYWIDPHTRKIDHYTREDRYSKVTKNASSVFELELLANENCEIDRTVYVFLCYFGLAVH